MQNTIKQIRACMQNARMKDGRTLYDEREVRAITDLLLEEVCGITRTDRVLHPDRILTAEQRSRLFTIAAQLEQGQPVQQALGYEYFCGQRFAVSPDVLIPRPETAELVSWIVDDASLQNDIRILDIGTGSGCIALSLARLIHNSQVTALDLSTAALRTAWTNACQQGVDNVQFIQGDILANVENSIDKPDNQELSTRDFHKSSTFHPRPISTIYQQDFDIIVSNPPYICRNEAAEMSPLVLDHEPDMALFVPDDDPLRFYRAIGHFAAAHLKPNGMLYFEINAAYGPATCQLLSDLGFPSVELRQDINARDRMVKASLTPHSNL